MKLEQLGWSPAFNDHFAAHRAAGLAPGRVIRQKGPYSVVATDAGDLTSENSGRLRHEANSRADLPAVGDWVAVAPSEHEHRGVIHAVLPRFSRFSRKVKGAVTEEQVVAANVDTIFLVSGLDEDYNVRRIERYLTLAWASGASPVIVLNKSDLCEDVEQCMAEVFAVDAAAPIHAVSAISGDHTDELHAYITPGKTVAFLGSSGVGKSALINYLIGEERQAVGEVRARDGKGQHTTTHRELILLPGGGMLIDTPGMRELQLWLDEESLKSAFKDIEELGANCRFRDCCHEAEPGCAVREAIENGDLDAGRMESYADLLKEVQYLAKRQGQRSSQIERAKWKPIRKAYRKFTKNRNKGK
jgi:ribosome biogenesis GTPase / thiamine phosphate phosphatase